MRTQASTLEWTFGETLSTDCNLEECNDDWHEVSGSMEDGPWVDDPWLNKKVR